MLSRRLQTLVNNRDRATLLRLYVAGIHVQPNLQPRCSTSRYQSFPMKRTLNPICATQQRLASVEKQYTTIKRCTHTSADDNISAEVSFNENSYARNVLASSAKSPKSLGSPLETIETVSYADAETILCRDWKASSAVEILVAFKSLSCQAKYEDLTLSQDKHAEILCALVNNLQQLDDEMLQQVFQCLLLWKGRNCPAYSDLWMGLDRECIKRLPSWSLDEKLRFADYWYQLHLARKAKYILEVTRTLGKKPGKLNAINFLHLMFLLNVSRKPTGNMYEIEYRFDSLLNEFTVNELGVIAMAFFKTATLLRDQKIIMRIHKILLREWDDVHDISLSAIMKMSRHSASLKDVRNIFKILDRVKSRIFKLSLPCLVHVTHAAAFVQCYDAEFVQMIMKRFERNIDVARVKDMERISWALLIFGCGPETPLYHQIVTSLRDPKRQDEITQFNKSVSTTLSHLSHAGVFPIDLIQKFLSADFLVQYYNNNVFKLGWELFALENNVKIEFPQYDGPFLNDNLREFLAKKFTQSVQRSKEKARYADKFALEVAHMCKLALRSDTAVHIDQLLPHFGKPDIAVCLDEENNPVAPEPVLSKIPIGTIKYAPKEVGNLRWIAIVLATQNQLLTGTEKRIGPFICKIRQLKKIGYTPVVITFIKWNQLRTLEAKQNYLRTLLTFEPDDRKVSAEAV